MLIAMRDAEGDMAENARALLHVEACPYCSHFLWKSDEMLFLAGEELRAAPPPTPPAVSFAEAARRRPRPAFRDPLAPQPVQAGVRPWLRPAAAAIAALLVIALIVPGASVSLRADALLERAVLQEAARGDDAAPPRVRAGWEATRRFGREERPPAEYGPVGVTREIGLLDPTAGPLVPPSGQPFVAGAPLDEPTARLLALHQFDPRNPLSVSRFRSWRASLPHKRDHLLLSGDMHRLLRVTTSDGPLREVEIEFRGDVLEVVRVAFLFDGWGRLEFHSLEQWPTRDRRATRLPLEASRRPALRPDEAAALDEAELDIWTELRRSELDLENGVDVAREADGLVVKLPSTPAARRLEPALEALSPRVRIRRIAATSRTPAAASAITGGRTGANGSFTGWTVRPVDGAVRAKDVVQPERQLGAAARPWMERWQELAFEHSPQERLAYSTELMRSVTEAHRLTELLKRLAARYSQRAIDGMPSATRIKLQRLVSLQHEALAHTLNQIGYRLAAVGRFTLVTPTFACRPRVSDPAWRRVTSRAPDRAATLRESISRLVSEKNPALDADGRCDLRQIDREFVLLWDAVNGSRVCDK